VKRACTFCSLVIERERERERVGKRERGREREREKKGGKERNRERERERERERDGGKEGERVRKKERELHARTSRKCGHAESLSVPQSVSQSACVIMTLISGQCYKKFTAVTF
jgi:hypothetical protein